MISIIALLGYIFAAFSALGTLISGFGAMKDSFFGGVGILIGGFIIAALIFFITRFWKEAALILVDIGDSITDANSRTQSSNAVSQP